MELQRDQKRFHRPQRQQRRGQNQWQPQHRVKPERRLIFYLHDQRASDDDRAGKHDDEDSGSVAGVDERVIQSTDVTLRPKREEAGKQLAVAAAWAPATKPSPRAL